MRFWIILLIALLILGTGGFFLYQFGKAYLAAWNRPNYREVAVVRGEITSVVNATGTIQPVLRVQVGAFVSGPIEKLYVDFNQKVMENQFLAKIDTRLYDAAVKRDRASLHTREAEVKRVRAVLNQAIGDENRAIELRKENEDYLSTAELDQLRYNRESLEAQLELAGAAVEQAQATLENSEAQLGYTDIRCPVDGIVIDRKIDEGQTLVAQFQTPELFVVAPNMEEKMRVFALVDEADIGFIREAQRRHERVHFTVDAYLDELFEGTIFDVRMNPTTVQNVVTYPVVVECPNPDLKLLPGMTANLSFEIDRRENVLKIPNAALRFYPKTEQVHPDDRKLLQASEEEVTPDEDTAKEAEKRSAAQRALANRTRTRRHVWVREGDFLRAVEVTTGLSDNKHTEMVAGPLAEGQLLVVGTASGPTTQ